MKKKQHYMTKDERIRLEAYRRAGKSVAWIARELGFCRQTIYNELRRGSYVHTCPWYDEVRYSADKAQQIHERNQTAKGRELKIGRDHAYAAYLEHMIVQQRYSPAAALAAARKAGFETSVCTSTLYSYIDKEIFRELSNRHLWQKPKRRRAAAQLPSRVVHGQLPSIEQRPEEINRRSERGHWEMDLVVSCKGSNAVLLTLTERMTRQELIFRLPDRRAATIRSVFDRLERCMGKRAFREKFRSITTDNGPEFLHYDELTRSVFGGSRFVVYYCHSYAAWEKGSNENHNRMIRRFFPKGTDFGKITKKRIAALQDWMNGYPRKILGWKSPDEAA